MTLRLLMPFHDQSRSFAYGFEAGKLYAEMEGNQRVISGTYNEENHQQLLLCAQTNGYRVVKLTGIGSGYVHLDFRKPWGRWLLGWTPFGAK